LAPVLCTGHFDHNFMETFKKGLKTGLLLQIAIGPVFLFVVNTALQKTFLNALAAVLGVTLVDYFYIILAINGVGNILEREKLKKIFAIISSLVLEAFGAVMIKNAITSGTSTLVNINSGSPLTSLLSAFFLAISSPIGIVFWGSVFTSKAMEYKYTKKELFIFGLSAGLSTPVFMGSGVILFSLIKVAVPIMIIQLLNLLVGFALIGYGLIQLTKM
jgi:threonine/homoserine/homoserine lactone efflux protein